MTVLVSRLMVSQAMQEWHLDLTLPVRRTTSWTKSTVQGQRVQVVDVIELAVPRLVPTRAGGSVEISQSYMQAVFLKCLPTFDDPTLFKPPPNHPPPPCRIRSKTIHLTRRRQFDPLRFDSLAWLWPSSRRSGLCHCRGPSIVVTGPYRSSSSRRS